MFTTEYIEIGRMELAWTNGCITTFCDNSSVIKDLYQWSMLEFYVTNFLYHTWVWNRGICMCVIVRPRSEMLVVLRKVTPATTRYDFA